jgi:hypothetical protein
MMHMFVNCKRIGEFIMRLIEKTASYEIWAVRESYGDDFYVYSARGGDPRVCPSIGMAREVAAGF